MAPNVNVPVDPKTKEKDVNAKLQLYGIYAAFANGKVPSNKQIDVAMNTALEWNGLKNPSKKLSTDGQRLVGDLRDVIEKAKVLLLTKNQGDLLQDFIWSTQHIGSGDANGVNAPVDKDTAQQHGQQALEGLRTLGELIITNGQFRKLLNDASVLARDIIGDGAQKAAEKINPDDEQLQQIDEPAEDNTWHDKPDLSKENMKQQLQNKSPVNLNKSDVDKVKGDATQAADPNNSRDPNHAADVASREAQQGQNNTSLDPKAGAKQAKDSAKQAFHENVDEDKKQQAREYRERTNEYFKQKMPKERREQTIYRLKKMIVEIQGHSDYQQAIDTILRLAEEYKGYGKDVADQSTGAVKGAHTQTSLQRAETDLKTLLERFANSTSFDDLIDSINQMYRDAEQDPELKKWYRTLNEFVRKCLKQQGYILEDSSNEEWNKIYDHGNFLLRERYRDHTNRVADETKFLAEQFDKDPQNKAFANSMDKLFKDLGNDENGNAEFKPHLVKDLTEVLLPAFFENVRYVPIPRIEVSDPMVDAIVENLVLEGSNLAPNQLEFGSDNYWSWGRQGYKSKNKNKVLLSVAGIQCDLRDVAYYVKKKQGFPSITDKGIMDISLGGSGLSFKVAMETADKSDRHHFFKINTVKVDIQQLQIKLKQSNHKLLFSLFKPLLLKVLKPVIVKAVEKQIRDNVHQLDAKLYEVKKEADRATEEAKNNPDPENLQNIYQRYLTAIQHQFTKGEQKKQELKEKKDKTDVNLAVTKHDSMFKNISLPGGISTKATEYKEMAAKGEAWQSPVFSIGSAGESKNLPSVSNPTRKPHAASAGQIRGGNHPNADGSSGNTSGNTNGFSSQVNDAFKPESNFGNVGQTSGLGQSTGLQNTSSNTNTSLGINNPVLQGSV